MFLLGGKEKVGLDIGAHALKLVLASEAGGNLRVRGSLLVKTPPGAVTEGEIVDPEAIIAALGPEVARQGWTRRHAVASVSGRLAVVRKLRFPRMPDNELAEVIMANPERHIPLPGPDALVDYLILPPPEPPGAWSDVLLVAVPRRAVEALIAVIEGVGLRPAAIEAEQAALSRALETLSAGAWAPAAAGGRGRDSVVLIDLGSEGTRVGVFDPAPSFFQTLHPGGADFARVFTKTFSEKALLDPAEVADRLAKLMENDLGLRVADLWNRFGTHPVRTGADALIHMSVFIVEYQELLERLVQEVWRSIEAFLDQDRSRRISRVYLAGGMVLEPGIAECVLRWLSERFVAHAAGGAFGGLPPTVNNLAVPAGLGPQFVTALGLALWKEKP